LGIQGNRLATARLVVGGLRNRLRARILLVNQKLLGSQLLLCPQFFRLFLLLCLFWTCKIWAGKVGFACDSNGIGHDGGFVKGFFATFVGAS
jgi:hypothetical protein